MLKMMCWVGLVWDIREVPDHVLEEGRRRARGGQAEPAVGERENQNPPDDELGLAA